MKEEEIFVEQDGAGGRLAASRPEVVGVHVVLGDMARRCRRTWTWWEIVFFTCWRADGRSRG